MNSTALASYLFRGKGRGGFTLIEMLVTLSIFVLLSASVFEILTGVLRGAAALQDNQNHSDQILALQEFLKNKLSGMPARSLMISYQRGDGEELTQNGIVLSENGIFTAIDAKVQANGYYTLRLGSMNEAALRTMPNHAAEANYTIAGLTGTVRNLQQPYPTQFIQLVSTNDPSLKWSPLIRDLKRIDWKFRDANAPDWQDVWNNNAAKPNLIELSIQIAGDLQSSTMDFWIPRITQMSVAPNN